jgi:hypothetical protein
LSRLNFRSDHSLLQAPLRLFPICPDLVPTPASASAPKTAMLVPQ